MFFKNGINQYLEKKKATVLLLKILFFSISFLEIISEYFMNGTLLWFTKPLIIPLLISLYVVTSKRYSYLYIVALLLNWLANIFFLFSDVNFLIVASMLFMFHRLLVLIKIFKEEKNIGIVAFLLGIIPFLFLFLSLINIIFDTIQKNQFILIVMQCILMSILGGLSLGSYFMKNNLSSRFLLISSLFFGINLFVLGVKFYFLDLRFLKPISMVFFVFGQYLFYKYMLLIDKD